jgi:hypothetical protein
LSIARTLLTLDFWPDASVVEVGEDEDEEEREKEEAEEDSSR